MVKKSSNDVQEDDENRDNILKHLNRPKSSTSVSSSSSRNKKHRRRRLSHDEHFTYIKRMLKTCVDPTISINEAAVHMISDFIHHHVERICIFANMESTFAADASPKTSSDRQLRFSIISNFANCPALADRMCAAGDRAVARRLASISANASAKT